MGEEKRTEMTLTPPIPPPSEWRDFPVLVTRENADGDHVPCPLNESVPVSSRWFDGVAIFFVRSDNDDEISTSYFAGKRRKAGVLLSGKFKERIPLHEVSVGSGRQIHGVLLAGGP